MPRLPVRLTVGGHQLAGEALPTERCQVHDQERKVVGDVERTQRWGELDAVDDLGRFAKQYVLGRRSP